MNTSDLKSTLSNLLSFLQGQKDGRMEPLAPFLSRRSQTSSPVPLPAETLVGLRNFGSNVSDVILECANKRQGRKTVEKEGQCGRGLGEILAIPEAFLNRQISSDSFRSYMSSEKGTLNADGSCCGKISSFLRFNILEFSQFSNLLLNHFLFIFN